MRIGLDARYGFLARRRGIGVYIYQLLKAWQHMDSPDFEFVAFVDGSADPAVVDEFRGTRIQVVPLFARPFVVWEQWALPRAAQAHHVDVVHAMANVGPLHLSLPLVVTMHDVIEWHRGRDFPSQLSLRHRWSRLYRMNAMRLNAQKAARIITVSHHAARDIVRTLKISEDKLHIIPEGFFKRRVAPDPTVLDEAGLAPRQYAMAFGAMDARKNIGMLMDLWARHSMAIPLVLIGFEPKALTDALAHYGQVPHLHLRGFESDGRVQALLDNARVFLYPSYYEGFGLPVLEAMAAGTPVVVAQGTAAEEVAGGFALVASPSDPNAWAKAITACLSDPKRWQFLSEAGRRRAATYNWFDTARAILAVYQEIGP